LRLKLKINFSISVHSGGFGCPEGEERFAVAIDEHQIDERAVALTEAP